MGVINCWTELVLGRLMVIYMTLQIMPPFCVQAAYLSRPVAELQRRVALDGRAEQGRAAAV